MRPIYSFTFILLVSVFFSCKKDTKQPTDDFGIDKSKTYTADEAEQVLKEDVWYYYKVLSLWQDDIPPDNINKITEDSYIRNNYTQYFEHAGLVLDFLKAKTPLGPSGKPMDRYSFLDDQRLVRDEIQNAVATSFGMYVFYLGTAESVADNDNAYLYIRMVDHGSPADRLGLGRGDRILSINGNTRYDYNTQLRQNFAGINAELNKPAMLIKWVTPAGVTHEKTMQSGSYPFDPILSHKVFDVNQKKVGYLAFSSFVNIVNENNTLSQMYRDLETIFSGFEAQGTEMLIMDLRYNGGGSLATAEYIVDKLAPISADGKQMYYNKLNNLLSRHWKWTRPDSAFAPVSIRKTGGLNLKRVYFLVTEETASASEMVINCLKPYLDVQLIGPEKTYGKPVGYFPIEVGKDEEVDLYAISFQMFNAQGFGDYFDGLNLNKQSWENYFLDFGDPEETLIAQALYHVSAGSYATVPLNKSASVQGKMVRPETIKPVKKVGHRVSDYGMFKFK